MEPLDMLKALLPEETDAVLSVFLTLAEKAVLKKLYPFDPNKNTVPERYYENVVNLALYRYNKQGAEGQTSHSENGVSRTYQSEAEILSDIVPYVGMGERYEES